MKTNAKQYAVELIDKLGKEEAEENLNSEMESLTKDGHASSNINQISFFLRALKYIKK